MFSKSKEADTAPAQPSLQKRVQRPTSVPSIISADLTVTGTLVSEGDLQIDGRVEGDIRATALVIGESAIIQGDIYAEELIVRGRIEGGIRARKVQLSASSHVEGNIMHHALMVESGAFFEGNCRHSDDPLGEASSSRSSRRSATQSARAAPDGPVIRPASIKSESRDEIVPQVAAASLSR